MTGNKPTTRDLNQKLMEKFANWAKTRARYVWGLKFCFGPVILLLWHLGLLLS